jgi:pyruvate carboxylase
LKNTKGSSRSMVTLGKILMFVYRGFHMLIHTSSISVIPTRYFLGRPSIGEEMHISIEKGKTLIIRLMAVGPVVEGRAQRDVWFEVNGEVSDICERTSCLDSNLHRFRCGRCQSRTRTPRSRRYLARRQRPILAQSARRCRVL